jgi:copper transport protein
MSAVDGHIAGGSYSFGVGIPAQPPLVLEHVSAQVQAAPVSLPGALAKWIFYLGAFVAAGTAAFVTLIAPAMTGAVRLRRLMLAGLAVLLAGQLAVLAVQLAASDPGRWGRILFSSQFGVFSLARIALAVGAALLVGWPGAGLKRWRMTAVLMAGVLLLTALASHAGASRSARLPRLATDFVHVLAGALWLGPLPALWLHLRSAKDEAGPAVRRFSAMATLSIAVLAMTGAIQYLANIGDPGLIKRTLYGQTWLVKMALFAALLVLGFLNRQRLAPAVYRVGRGTAGGLRALRLSVCGEIFIGAALLATVGLLTVVAPAAQERASAEITRPRQVIAQAQDQDVHGILVVKPGLAGVSNSFLLNLTDAGGKPIVDATVELRFEHTDMSMGLAQLRLESQGMGTYQGATVGRYQATGTALSMDGRWRIVALVRRSGLDDAALEFNIQARLATF